MAPVRVMPEARQDARRLANFAGSKSAGAGLKARTAIQAAIQSLGDFPERGAPARMPDARELFVRFGRYGYVLRYLVEPGRVIILRIFHSREER